MQTFRACVHLGRVVFGLGGAALAFIGTTFRSRTALAAENLFLRKQLALYRERQVEPRRASDPLRLALVLLARCSAWREAPTIVQPATLLRWHREVFRLLWRWRLRSGRPPLPADLRRVIATMARDNPTWGGGPDRRGAAAQGRVSPRTIRRYMARGSGGGGRGATGRRWAAFLRNHARALVACDFCVVVTATFRVLYIFVALEVGSRRLLRVNVTRHPTDVWTQQQFREVLAAPHPYRFVVPDRDSISSPWLDAAVTALGVRVLRPPVQAPRANAYCARLLGSLRRERLAFLIPFGEDHLRPILRVWGTHYNRGRPHSSLGPGLPEPSATLSAAPIGGHRLPRDTRVVARPILGGLHHEYGLAKLAA